MKLKNSFLMGAGVFFFAVAFINSSIASQTERQSALLLPAKTFSDEGALLMNIMRLLNKNVSYMYIQ